MKEKDRTMLFRLEPKQNIKRYKTRERASEGRRKKNLDRDGVFQIRDKGRQNKRIKEGQGENKREIWCYYLDQDLNEMGRESENYRERKIDRQREMRRDEGKERREEEKDRQRWCYLDQNLNEMGRIFCFRALTYYLPAASKTIKKQNKYDSCDPVCLFL